MKRLVVLLTIASALVLSATPASARSAPASCMKALDAADQLRTASAEFTRDVSVFFGNVHDNAMSNDTDPIAFIQQLTTDISALTARATAATPGIRDASARLSTYEARCRAGR